MILKAARQRHAQAGNEDHPTGVLHDRPQIIRSAE
jgi:hypothetical protein